MRPRGYFVDPSAIVDDGAQIGEGTRIWHFVHIMSGARIGSNCVFGQNCFVGNVRIGDGTHVQNNVSIYDGVTLEDHVFAGPSCVFTNVVNPRSEIERKDEYAPTLVCRGATIGANATILCGVTLGAYCFVGAGAVVTSDVVDYALVVGVPARRIGWVCACGVRLPTPGGGAPMDVADAEVVGEARVCCGACGAEYRVAGEMVAPT